MLDTKLHRDTAANLVGALLPVAITLATVPPYLRLIGVERFGVLALASVLLGYFGLFEVGTGDASARYIAAHSGSSPRRRESVFWTVFAINAALGGAAGIVLWVAGRHLLSFLHMSNQMRSELIPALPWLGAAVPLVTTITVLAGALDGRQRFVASNLLRLVGECTFQVIPLLVAIFHGPNLTWLLASAVLARVISAVLLFLGCWKHVPLSGLPRIDSSCIREMFLFGGWATLSGLLYPLLKTMDQFFIGALRGPTAVAYYSIPYQLATKLIIIPNSIVRSLFPRLAMRSRKDAIDLAEQSLQAMVALTTLLALVSIAALSPFLRWWLGPTVAHSSSLVGELLIVGSWLTGCTALSGKLLVAQGRPDLVAKVQAAEIAPFIAVLWLAVRVGGIQGAASAWVLRSAVEALLLFWLAALSWRVISSLLIPLAMLFTAVLCAHIAGDSTWMHAFLGGSVLLIAGGWMLRQSPSTNQKLKGVFGSLLSRPRPPVLVDGAGPLTAQNPTLSSDRSICTEKVQ